MPISYPQGDFPLLYNKIGPWYNLHNLDTIASNVLQINGAPGIPDASCQNGNLLNLQHLGITTREGDGHLSPTVNNYKRRTLKDGRAPVYYRA